MTIRDHDYYNSEEYILFPDIDSFRGNFIDERSKRECFYLYDYLPVSRKSEVRTPHDAKIARLLFRFKEGNSMAADVVAAQIKEAIENEPMILRDGLENTILLPISASTEERNDIRYKKFCERLSSSLGIRNGYAMTDVMFDRDQNKGKINHRDFHNQYISPDDVKGCHILLFDDLFTTGKTFYAVASSLNTYDIKAVTGIFIAKTLPPR